MRTAFRAEVEYYVVRSHEGRDEATLALLRRDCAHVFLEAAGAPLDAGEFAPSFVGALEFDELPGSGGRLPLARGGRVSGSPSSPTGTSGCTTISPHSGSLRCSTQSSPRPRRARRSRRRRSSSSRSHGSARRPIAAVHVGDADADAEGARAAGLRFEPAPLADAARRILA